MPDTKPKNSQNSDETIDPALEQRVDAMMDTHLPVSATAPELTDPELSSETDVVTNTETTQAASHTEPLAAQPDAGTVEAASQLSDELPPEIDPVIDDIVAHEGDELLVAHDARIAAMERANKQAATSLKTKIADFIRAWWQHKWARYGTLAGLFVCILALSIMPSSRYYAMNTAGIRSAASLSIIDNTNQQPLKNVTVVLGSSSAKTNQDGVVKLSGLRLGSQQLKISQAGFAPITKTVTLGWGSNPLGDFTLNAVGTQFRFKLTDYLSGKILQDAEVSSGDSHAQTDKAGQIVLTVGQGVQQAPATITASGYRSQKLTLQAGGTQDQTIVMVPAAPEVYISKQSGKYDLYKTDLDGKNKQLLLPASGYEDTDMAVVQSPDAHAAALVSKRDTLHDQDGYQLQALTVVDVDKSTALVLDHSERIQIVDWIGNKLVYVRVKAGTSAGNPERYQLMSYDYDTTSRLLLASANNFSDVVSAQGNIYFAASNDFQGGTSQMVRIKPDSTGKQVLVDDTDIWSIFRTSYDGLTMSSYNASYSYGIGDTAAKKTSDAPLANSAAHFYLDRYDGKQALWTDSRDGKGVLLVHDSTSGKDTVLATQTGLNYPLRWLNPRTVVYRVVTPTETADYAVSLDGGAPKKIIDLTNASGFGRWNNR